MDARHELVITVWWGFALGTMYGVLSIGKGSNRGFHLETSIT